LSTLAVGFVSPESFGLALSLAFVVGIVVGGLASLGGALFGALFIEFVPNIADQLTVSFGDGAKALPGAIYGVLLILVMAAMPTGVAGAARAAARAFAPSRQARVESGGVNAAVKYEGKEDRRSIDGHFCNQAPPLAFAASASSARANAPGVTDTEIKIGQRCPIAARPRLTASSARPTRLFQNDQRAGWRERAQDQSDHLDDGYSPPKTVEQTRRLVEQEQVAFLFNSLGTACCASVRQYMNDNKIPQLFVATGASMFSDPEHFPWTMGWQPNYQTEAAIFGKHIAATKPDAKIGVLYQNDSFGKDYLIGLKNGLGADHAGMVIKEVSYETSEPTVDSQIVTLQGAGVDLVLYAATPKFAAQAIRKTYDIGWTPVRYDRRIAVDRVGDEACRS
jgi:hypothetical protein